MLWRSASELGQKYATINYPSQGTPNLQVIHGRSRKPSQWWLFFFISKVSSTSSSCPRAGQSDGRNIVRHSWEWKRLSGEKGHTSGHAIRMGTGLFCCIRIMLRRMLLSPLWPSSVSGVLNCLPIHPTRRTWPHVTLPCSLDWKNCCVGDDLPTSNCSKMRQRECCATCQRSFTPNVSQIWWPDGKSVSLWTVTISRAHTCLFPQKNILTVPAPQTARQKIEVPLDLCSHSWLRWFHRSRFYIHF